MNAAAAAAQDFSFGEFDEASSTLIMTNRPPAPKQSGAPPTLYSGGSGMMPVATPYESAIVPVAKPVVAPMTTILPPPVADDSTINPVTFDSGALDTDPTASTKKYRRATIVLSFALLTALSLAGTLAYAMFSGTQALPLVPRVAHQGVTRSEQLSVDRPISSPDVNLKPAAPTKKAKKKRAHNTNGNEPTTQEEDLSGRDLLSDGLGE